MNWYDAMEEAYNKGYKKGQEDARKPGKWEPHPNHPGFDRCSECHDCIVANDWVDGRKWKFCPECGARMDQKTVRSCANCENDGMDIPQCKECNPGNDFRWFREKV